MLWLTEEEREEKKRKKEKKKGYIYIDQPNDLDF